MNRQWPDPEDLYHEGVRTLIEMIQELQKIIENQDDRILDLNADIEYYKGEIVRSW